MSLKKHFKRLLDYELNMEEGLVRECNSKKEIWIPLLEELKQLFNIDYLVEHKEYLRKNYAKSIKVYSTSLQNENQIEICLKSSFHPEEEEEEHNETSKELWHCISNKDYENILKIFNEHFTIKKDVIQKHINELEKNKKIKKIGDIPSVTKTLKKLKKYDPKIIEDLANITGYSVEMIKGKLKPYNPKVYKEMIKKEKGDL